MEQNKILFSIIGLVLILGSCNTNEHKIKHVDVKTYTISQPNTSARVELNEYTIDSCQYLGFLGGDSRSWYLTHKGNCNNLIHNRTEKEIRCSE
jgi:hypothetical protein